MNKSNVYIGFLPLSGVFIVLTVIIYFLSLSYPQWIPLKPLLLGNLFFYGLMIMSMYLMTASSGSHSGFFRGFYLSTFVRLFATTAIILLLYKWADLPKTSIFILLGLYFIYMFTEVVLINQRISKRR